MHRHHLVGCAVGIAIALLLVALTGGSAGTIGILLAVALCPLLMAGALVLLARSANAGAQPAPDSQPVEPEQLTP